MSEQSLTCFVGGGAQQTGFGKAAQSTLGRFITKPMSRDEACKILNIEETPELNHVEIMEVSNSSHSLAHTHIEYPI